jgi:predicted DNA binding protein
MAVIVRGSVPAAEIALHDVLTSLPDVTLEVERIIESGEEAVMPLVWVRNSDRQAVEAAIEDDPTVNESAVIGDFDGELLFRMEWIDRVRLLVHMLTNFEATILDAYGEGDCWHLRVLYPNRELFARTHEFCEDHGITFQVAAVREMAGEPAGRYGLTDDQYHVLVEAARRGYFSVPQEVTLAELADEAGVSHQALSERLRRATEALVEDTLMIGYAEGEPEEGEEA